MPGGLRADVIDVFPTTETKARVRVSLLWAAAFHVGLQRGHVLYFRTHWPMAP